MVTVFWVAVVGVVTVKLAELSPAEIVTLFGTFTVARLLVSLMTNPPAGAGPLRPAVPVELLPPRTDEGFSETETNARGTSLTVAVSVVVPKVALIVTVCAVVTATDVRLNVAVVCPPATVTVGGTVTRGPLLEREITEPALGAGPLIVTDPTADAPPATVLGATLTDVRAGAFTVRFAVLVDEPNVAVKVAVTTDGTGEVPIVKVVVSVPAGTVTVPGTVTAPLFDVKLTTVPPEAAGPEIVKVPVDGDPPVTVVGCTVIDESVGGLIVRVAVC
jgi:hypothetical protein